MSHEKLAKLTRVFLFISVILAFIILLLYASKLYNEPTLTAKPSNESNRPKLTLQEANIKTIIRNIVLLLNDIVPPADKSEKHWFPVRFYFVDGYNFYVEYTNNVETRKILISIKGDKLDKKENYEIIAYFKPGKNMWDLISGNDLFFDKEKLVYEYNINKTAWEIK